MTSGLGLGRTLALVATCTTIALAPRPAGGALPARPHAAAPTVSGVAAQLGLKVHVLGEDFGVGTSFTGSLRDPEKLASFGVAGFHTGARVTVLRMAPERVVVDADEDEPAPLRKTTRLRIGADGTLSAVPKA